MSIKLFVKWCINLKIVILYFTLINKNKSICHHPEHGNFEFVSKFQFFQNFQFRSFLIALARDFFFASDKERMVEKEANKMKCQAKAIKMKQNWKNWKEFGIARKCLGHNFSLCLLYWLRITSYSSESNFFINLK